MFHQELPTAQALSRTENCGAQYGSEEQPVFLEEDTPVNHLVTPSEESPLEHAATTGLQGPYVNLELKDLNELAPRIPEREKGLEMAGYTNRQEVTLVERGYETCNPQIHPDMHVTTEPSTENIEQPEVTRKAHTDCVMEKNRCISHNQLLEKMKVTKKVWKDRGKGRGFGYVSSKVTKLFCNPKTRGSVSPTTTNVLSDSNGQEEGLVTFGNTLMRFSEFNKLEKTRPQENIDRLPD